MTEAMTGGRAWGRGRYTAPGHGGDGHPGPLRGGRGGRGGGACGRVRYTAQVHDDDAYLCHCRMCQRVTGSISIAFKNIMKPDLVWESGPDYYVSSPIARRPYCRE